ncbi:MAG: AAA family ATPase [Bacillota bacterium]
MTVRIAVAGKGGTGKTTFAALAIRHLTGLGQGPVLAVDADPNSNLHEALGLEARETIAGLLEETKQTGPLPAGMSRTSFIQYRLQSALVEAKGVDLLVMGTPEGAGCYCYPNSLLRDHLAGLTANYAYLVVDNEAGLEHLSRRIAQEIDILFVLSDASVRGIRTAGRVRGLVADLGLNVAAMYLVLTRAGAREAGALATEIAGTGLPLLGTVPLDPAVSQHDLSGLPMTALPAGSPAVTAVADILARAGQVGARKE